MSDIAQPVFNMPQRRSWAAARAIPASGVDRLVARYLTIDLVCVVLLQKIAIPAGGDSQVQIVSLTHFGVLAMLAYYGRLRVSTFRVVLLALATVIGVVAQFVSPADSNWFSFILFLYCYCWMPLVVRANRATYTVLMRNLVTLGVVAGVLTYFDHVCQVFGPGMPNMNLLLPANWDFHNYVYIQPIFWGSRIMKPNGFFFLEVSHLSQFIALSLVVELTLFRRLSRVVFIGSSLMVTFAGTGLLIMVLCSPFIAAKLLKPKLIILGLILVPLALGVAAVSGWFDVISHRTGEFDKHNTSANGRFIEPYGIALDVFYEGSPEQILFGNGAGRSSTTQFMLHNVLTKSFVEYGLLFTTTFVIMMLTVMFGSGAPIAIIWAALILYQVVNGAFLIPMTIIEVWLLTGAYKFEPEPRGARARRVPHQSVLLAPRDDAAAGSSPVPSGRVFG